MTDCSILSTYINNFKNNLGYFPSYEQCSAFLQNTGMNEIQVSNCLTKYLTNPSMNGGLYNNTTPSNTLRLHHFKGQKPHYNNGDISMGVL